MTYKNGPTTYPLFQEVRFQGEVVAIVAAETEDLAEDAAEAIQVEYDVLPFASTVKAAMAPNAPDLRQGKGNLMQVAPNSFYHDPNASWVAKHGDVEKAFAEADIVKEYSYYFAGAAPVPIQPCGCVAKWEGDQLTIWGMAEGDARAAVQRVAVGPAMDDRPDHRSDVGLQGLRAHDASDTAHDVVSSLRK